LSFKDCRRKIETHVRFKTVLNAEKISDIRCFLSLGVASCGDLRERGYLK
jgi:hypothetical protein